MSKQDEIIIAFVWFCIGVFVALIIAFSVTESHSNIIKHGCGQYNSQTSNFEWVPHD